VKEQIAAHQIQLPRSFVPLVAQLFSHACCATSTNSGDKDFLLNKLIEISGAGRFETREIPPP
jgi:hypothetical protein